MEEGRRMVRVTVAVTSVAAELYWRDLGAELSPPGVRPHNTGHRSLVRSLPKPQTSQGLTGGGGGAVVLLVRYKFQKEYKSPTQVRRLLTDFPRSAVFL